MTGKTINGFSKLSKRAKISWLVEHFFSNPDEISAEMMSFWHKNEELQHIIDGFSENTISNFVMPYGVAPNFLIDGNTYCVPMVIEESSVVAAAAAAAKYWMSRGGFKTEILGTQKIGQLHFKWSGDPENLKAVFPTFKQKLIEEATHLTENMQKRGGGISDVSLLDMTQLEPNYYQLRVTFETCDSMGANFINSVLENFGITLRDLAKASFSGSEQTLTIIMAILSNYTPDCIVRASVSCPVSELTGCGNLEATEFAEKFKTAVRIAEIDPYRATTHNKGIYNGVDAVVLATANDFRAIEACGHTYAARDGQYSSLSHCIIENGIFSFWLDLPLAVGTVGGLTKLHPMARLSLELLGNPSAKVLMSVIAATGLAQNFAALRSLVTTGIQQGHMKMHLQNILNHLGANEEESAQAAIHFEHHAVSFSSVRDFLSAAVGVRK
jgi:hydroxymethylglutaryl-CoA reductase